MSGLIRTAREADAAAIQAIYAPEVADGVATFETEPPTVDEIRGRIVGILPTYPWLVWETDAGEVAGYSYASRHRDRSAYRWSVDLAIYVGEAARGGGVARSLYAKLFDILARQRFHAAFAGVATPNPGSEGLHRACGFELIGVYREVGYKHGAWRDVGWWRLPLSDSAAHPQEPIPYSQLRGDAEPVA